MANHAPICGYCATPIPMDWFESGAIRADLTLRRPLGKVRVYVCKECRATPGAENAAMQKAVESAQAAHSVKPAEQQQPALL